MKPAARYSDQSRVDSRVGIRPSPIEGDGTFAADAFRTGETVVTWGGSTLFTQDEVWAGKSKPHSVAEVGEDLLLGSLPEEPESPDDLMNHSCEPNVWMRDEVTLVARNDIEPGEELTVDYAMFSTNPHWVMHARCNCRSQLCRGEVSGNDWKLEELQGRYRDHFSPFINSRIKKLTGR